MTGGMSQGIYPGCRATRDGGTWEPFRDDFQRAVCAQELNALTKHSDDERIMLRQELAEMMNAASAGQLRFGEGEDVDYMRREPNMLELRLTAHTFDPVSEDGSKDENGYKFRLYFAEPPIKPLMLLALKFAKARRTQEGLTEQDGHVDEASERYVKWTQDQTVNVRASRW